MKLSHLSSFLYPSLSLLSHIPQIQTLFSTQTDEVKSITFQNGRKQANNELLCPTTFTSHYYHFPVKNAGNLSQGYASVMGWRRAGRRHVILCNSLRRVIASLTLWPWSSLKWLSKTPRCVSRGELSNGFPVVHCPWVLPSQQVAMVMPHSSASLWTFCDGDANISFIKLMRCGSTLKLLIKDHLLWIQEGKSDQHKLTE